MKATIKYDYLEPGVIYYELPLFNCKLKKCGISYVGKLVMDEYYRNYIHKDYKQYSLYISYDKDFDKYNDGNGFQNGPELTEQQVREINKLYFYMLDNPELKEASINL